jgi:hypothetical protein
MLRRRGAVFVIAARGINAGGPRMPSRDRDRFHDQRRLSPAGEPSARQHPEPPIYVTNARPRSTQQLLSQANILRRQGRPRPEPAAIPHPTHQNIDPSLKWGGSCQASSYGVIAKSSLAGRSEAWARSQHAIHDRITSHSVEQYCSYQASSFLRTTGQEVGSICYDGVYSHRGARSPLAWIRWV